MNNTQTATQHATDTDVTSGATGPRWRRALGLQFLGPVQGSGLRDPAYLVRRTDEPGGASPDTESLDAE